jgi:hypothetical protein
MARWSLLRPDALGRIRTCDAGLRRAALYPLSYEGVEPAIVPAGGAPPEGQQAGVVATTSAGADTPPAPSTLSTENVLVAPQARPDTVEEVAVVV